MNRPAPAAVHRLHPGEAIRTAAGFPALVRFAGGAAGQPLVVFVTGGGVLARIAYGLPDTRPQDFLAHWLGDAGYPFLAVSYPLGHPVFPSIHPDFTVRDWAAQTAELARAVTDANGLPRTVLVLAWSMAGRIALPLGVAMRRLGLDIGLFVTMAATPPLPNLLPALDGLQMDRHGLAEAHTSFVPWLTRCLEDQSARAGDAVIAASEFVDGCTGNFPINLAATPLRYRQGRFVADAAEDDADTGARDIGGFPPLAVITHASALDARHALADQANWSPFLVQGLLTALMRTCPDCTKLPAPTWEAIAAQVRAAPDRLSVTLPGNHLFFVGAAGARATVEALALLQARSSDLGATLRRLSSAAHPPP